MKKLFTILAALALVALCVVLAPAQAQAVDASELTFTLNNDGQSYSITACPKTVSGELTIPATHEGKPVVAIGQAAFRDCTGLTKVVIPDSVQSIGNAAFSYCTRLVSINIPEGITEIGSDLFYKCYNLASITLPESVVSIGHYAFYLCRSLTEIDIPDSVFNIGEYAFASCNKLTAVELPASLTKVSNGAFYACRELRSVVIPEGVTTIGEAAFDYCLLFSAGLPKTLTSIAASAFDHCMHLRFVYFCGTDEQWDAITMAEGNEYLNSAERSLHKFVGGDCETEQTCAMCGLTGAFGHKWVPATCTEPHHCSVCQVIVRPALGHTWVEATCAEPKHCSVCAATEGDTMPHSYDNEQDHICNDCGFERSLKAPELKFLQTPSLSFQDYIGMQVSIYNATAQQYDKVYVQAVQQDFEKGAVTTVLEGVPFYFDLLLVFDQQILSWSMTEQVTLTLYAEKDGIVYEGQSYTESVETLALGMLEGNANGGNAKLCTVLVDMLNYGAAVQTSYKHNETNLPNTRLGAYSAHGTQEIPAMNAQIKKEGTGAVTVYQDSVSMQSKVELQMLFFGDVSIYTPKAVINGETVIPAMDTESMAAYGGVVLRLAVGAAQMRESFTIALYDAEGNAVTQVYTVSVEAYAKTMLGGAQNDIAVTMMRYGDAVAAYAAVN